MAQQAFGFRRSIATTSGCVVIVVSLSNSTATITCNSTSQTIATAGGDSAWSTIGEDAPAGHDYNGSQLGYAGNVTITGLTGGENYTYTVTQDGTTYSANIYVVPDGSTSDFALFFNTCDNNTSLGGVAGGYYAYMKQYAQSGQLPVAGILHVDDHYGYPDFALVDDSAGTGHYYISKDGAGTAKDTVTPYSEGDGPSATMYEYDYALAYFAAFGLFSDATNDYVAWGQDEDMMWCYRNLGMIPQWGDHDCGADDVGWDVAVSGNIQFTGSKNLYDVLQKPLVSTEITATQDNDATAYHWAKTLGPVRIVCPDGITNSSGDATTPLDAGNGPATLYGSDHINDCLQALDTTDEFKLLCLTYGIRYLGSGGGLGENNAGCQHPLADECAAEYAQFFTASGNDPQSIMDNDNTNGNNGTIVLLHGDYHVCTAQLHMSTAGDLDEHFYGLCVGTGTGSLNFANAYSLVEGSTHGGSTVEMLDTGGFGMNHYYGCRIDVYGSTNPKAMYIGLYDMNNAELWRKKYVSKHGTNHAFPVDAYVGATFL